MLWRIITRAKLFFRRGETTNHMIKSKFGSSVRSKSWSAQVNEVLCKIICHNICVVIMEMHTMGIEADFELYKSEII